MLRVFFHEHLVARAEAGKHNFTNRLRAAFDRVGVEVRLCRNTPAARALSAVQPGYALFHMDAPFHRNALTTRLVYAAPFWQIEASAKRWEWEVARAPFHPETVEPGEARQFQRRQAQAILGGDDTAREPGGFVYVPLQGMLRKHRSFQMCSPVEMIAQTLAHCGDRRVIAGLHPKESYSRGDLAALDALREGDRRLSVVTGQMAPLLRGCAYVVSQNSSVALFAGLVDKPAILFARIDFHHVALNVQDIGIAPAFAAIADHRPDFARYLYWFLKQNTLNAGAPEAEDQILAAVRRHGWQV